MKPNEAAKASEQRSLEEIASTELNAVNQLFAKYTSIDSHLDRKDTAVNILQLLQRIKTAIDQIINSGEEAREKLYYHIYNASVLIVTFTRALREGEHADKSVDYLIYAISIVDGNLILSKAKFLQWRVRLYCELANTYEGLSAFNSAANVIAYGEKQVKYLKELEEQDPPVPESTSAIISQATTVLFGLSLRYGLQSQKLTVDQWKKKLEAEFNTSNKSLLGMAIIESLTTCARNKTARLVGIKPEEDLPKWKSDAIQTAYSLLEGDIDLITKALQEQVEHKEREKQKNEEIADGTEKIRKRAEEKAQKKKKKEEEKKAKKLEREKKKAAGEEVEEEAEDEQEPAEGEEEEEEGEALPDIDEIVNRYRELDEKMIKEKDWKTASANAPLEIQAELIRLSYQAGLYDQLDKLIESAYIRLKYRRVEVPYVTAIDVLASIQKTPIIPNGYEMLPPDLNSLHLKLELAKLRASKKSGAGEGEGMSEATSSSPGHKQKAQEKKTESKKEMKKEGKKAEGKKAAPAKKEEEKKEETKEEEATVEALESELQQINHTYVRLIVEKNKNPTNAVCGLTIMFADPKIGPKVEGKQVPVVIPLQYEATTGSNQEEEIPKKLPFVVFTRTANALKDEEEQLGLITDIHCMICRDPFMPPPIGYQKIPIDMRENPTDLLGLNTREFIYLSYKTEKLLRNAERDIEIIKNLLELERSYKAADSEEYKNLSQAQKELQITFDLPQLNLLGTIIKDAILGPIGDIYIIERQDIMFDIVSLLYKKYLSPALSSIDYINTLEANEELLDHYQNEIKLLCAEALKIMSPVLLSCHRILNKLRLLDPVLYSEITLITGEIYETIEDFRTSIQVLRSGISKIIEYRESQLRIGNNCKENVISLMYITCDNYAIIKLDKDMDDALRTWQDAVEREERQKKRKKEGKALLDADEMNHEYEDLKTIEREKEKLAAGEDEEKKEDEKKTEEPQPKNALEKTKYTETDSFIIGLHCDMVTCLYRCELKLGRKMINVQSQTKKIFTEKGIEGNDVTKGVSTGLKMKMTIGHGATAKKTKKDQKYLEVTLQEAGKLPPPIPPMQSYESILSKEANKNSYLNAILLMQLAIHKLAYAEQKSLLMEALKFANASSDMEGNLQKLMLQNAVYLKSIPAIDMATNTTIESMYPFNLLKSYVPKTKVPQSPILVSRASTSICMMLPYFRPSVKSLNIHKNISLFGKVSVSGVGVSFNNNELEGTGVPQPSGALVVVKGLLPNEKYVFAAAGIAADNSCPHGIGVTSEEIVTVLPLSLFQIYAYIADVAFKLMAYETAKAAAEKVCSKVIEKTELKCNQLDTRVNPILAYQLNHLYIKSLSVCDIRHIANSFLILAKSLIKLKNNRYYFFASFIYIYIYQYSNYQQIRPITLLIPASLSRLEDQKTTLRIVSYLILALEVSSCIKDYILLKLIIIQTYNVLIDFFQTTTQSPLLLHALIKCHAALNIIPMKFMDSPLRSVASCILYQIALISLQNYESGLLKYILANDTIVGKRRWLTKTEMKEVAVEQEEEKKEEKKEGKKDSKKEAKKDAKKEEKKEEEKKVSPEGEEAKPQTKLVKQIALAEHEHEGEAADEFFLSLNQFNDIISINVNKWKKILESYTQVATDGENEIPKITANLDSIVQFWQSVGEDPGKALEQVLSNGMEGNPKYLEQCCKAIRRLLETSGYTEDIVSQIDSIEIAPELKKEIEASLAEQEKQLDGDVLTRAVRRLQVIEEICGNNANGDNKESIKSKVKDCLARQKDQTVSKEQPPQKPSAEEAEKPSVPMTPEQITEAAKWLSEMHFLKGAFQFEKYKQQFPKVKSKSSANYFDIKQMDFERMKVLLEDDDTRFKGIDMAADEKYTLMKAIIESHVKGCLYALKARADKIMYNLAVQLWNIFLYTQLSPAIHKKLSSWIHMIVISYTIIEAHKGGPDQKKQVRFQESASNEIDTSATVIAPQYANMISYCIQTLLVVEKWQSLADLCQRFIKRTGHLYGGVVLPFAIYAQNMLLSKAAGNTNSKKQELKARIEAFEKWSSTKKKKSREAMIMGSIPQEEQDFNRDRDKLTAEIMKLEIIQEFFEEDKQESSDLLGLIKRDSNTAKEALQNCRKLLSEYASQKVISDNSNSSGGDTQQKAAKLRQMGVKKLIGSYKKTIDILRERQENFMLVQSLHELGNIYYADDQVKEAGINWSDSLDTVYRKLYALSNYKILFKEVPVNNLVSVFGLKQCLNSLILLSKLSKYIHGNDLSKQYQCLDMALSIAYSPFKLTMPHPQQYHLFALHKFTELLTQNISLFDDHFELSGWDLLVALNEITSLAIDYEEYERVLPALVLMQYLAKSICFSNEFLFRARFKLCVSLAKIGYIEESLYHFYTIIQQRDIASINCRESCYYEITKGMNSMKLGKIYINSANIADEKNKKAISDLLAVDFKDIPDSFHVTMLKYAKAIILHKINETEDPVNALAQQDERNKIFKNLEIDLRDNLKQLGIIYQIAALKNEILETSAKLEEGKPEPETLTNKKTELKNMQDDSGKDIDIENDINYLDIKNDLLDMMILCRLLLKSIYLSQGLNTDAYYVITTSLLNFKQYCINLVSNVETGNDNKSKVGVIPEGIIAGLGSAASGASAAAKKGTVKEEKKGKKEEKKKPEQKKKPGEGGQEESEKLEEQEAQKKREQEIKDKELQNEQSGIREHITGYLWMKLKSELLYVLYYQGRYIDAEGLIVNIMSESEKLHDNFFCRIAKQINCYIHAKKGKYDECCKMYKEIIDSAKSEQQSDVQLALFMGNIAELMFRHKYDPSEVIEILKEGRVIMWQQLKNEGLEIEPIDINKTLQLKTEVKMLTQGVLKENEYFASSDTAANEMSQGASEDQFDFSTDISVELQSGNKELNSSYNAPNIYLRYLEQLIKYDLRYARILIADKNHQMALRVLTDTLLLQRRTLNITAASLFTAHLLSAICYKQLFKDAISSYDNTYLNKGTLPGEAKKKYENYAKAQPYGNEISLGVNMNKLPMFSHMLMKEFIIHIEKAKEEILECLKVASEEHVLLFEYEENLSTKRAFCEYADIVKLIDEYYPESQLLFVDAKSDKDKAKKEEKAATEEADPAKKSYKLLKYNLKQEFIFAVQKAIACEKMEFELCQNFAEMAKTTLIDASRVPKEVTIEIFESDFHAKKLYAELPSIETVPKTTIASADILLYLINVSNEMKMFTFSKESVHLRSPTLLSKLHRYLKTNLTPYANTCVSDYKPYEKTESLEEAGEYLAANNYLAIWSELFGETNKCTLLYALAPKDPSNSSPPIFGSTTVGKLELGKIYQVSKDLLKKYQEAGSKSEEVFERDKKNLMPDFEKILKSFRDLFAPPGAFEVNGSSNDSKVKEDMLKLLKLEFTEENLKEIAEILSSHGRNLEMETIRNMLDVLHRARFKIWE